MSAAPWQETPAKVVLEFRKGSENCKRKVRLSHGSQPVPPQLYGRVPPQAWEGLVADCSALALEHPHLAPATCGCCAENLFGMLNCESCMFLPMVPCMLAASLHLRSMLQRTVISGLRQPWLRWWLSAGTGMNPAPHARAWGTRLYHDKHATCKSCKFRLVEWHFVG
eukprot:363049-Chlamydomonas_euryale.AAC.19